MLAREDKGRPMRLTIVNVSKSVTSNDFHAAVAAIRRQVQDDFGPEWNIAAKLRSTTHTLAKGSTPIEGIHDVIIYVGDSSQDPTTGVEGALGYHSVNHKDVPYGF